MRKAQIKMGENVAVLLIFTVLLVMGIIFYMQYKKGSMKEDLREQRIKNAIETAQRIAYLPEVQCSEDGIQRENCYDWLKIKAAQEVIKEDQNYYYSLLGYSTIDIEQIYPNLGKIRLYEAPKKAITNSTSNETTQVPIAIYHPDLDTYSFGILKVIIHG